jgi:hypothetical protein
MLPETIREKIKTGVTKYLAEVDSWDTVSDLKTQTDHLFLQIADVIPLKCHCAKS